MSSRQAVGQDESPDQDPSPGESSAAPQDGTDGPEISTGVADAGEQEQQEQPAKPEDPSDDEFEDDEEEAPDEPDAPLSRNELLTSGSRTLAIGALLGIAATMYVQFAYQARWADDFLVKNTLGKEPRAGLIAWVVAGALLGVAISALLLVFTHRRRRSIARVERWAWFLSPLVLLPFAPMLFRYKPWQNKYELLLPCLIPILLAVEALVARSLSSVPRAVREWWLGMRDQVPALIRRQGPMIVVVSGALIYSVFFSFYLMRWHYKLRTGNFDISINNNLMFGGLYGDFLQSTVIFPSDPGKYLATHAKFGHYLFLPIYALAPRPETLFIIQSVLIGSSAIPLFAFARRHLSDWMAAILTLAYLLYYPMHGASFSEFQNVPIAAFFVFGVVWAADARRWVWFGIFTVIALLMREDIPVGTAIIGTFLLLSGHRPLPGLILAAVSTVYFLILRFYVMDEAGDWWFPNMYKELWADNEKGFKSVIKTLLTNPLFTLNKFLIEKKLIYLLHLFVPLAFLPARRWYLWAAFIPGTLLTLIITNYDPPITFSFHYIMHWAPYLFMAAVVALKAIRDEQSPVRMRAAAAAMVVSTLVLTYNYGAFSRRNGSVKGGFHKVDFTWTEADAQRYAQLKELIKDIPLEDSVAATEKVGPHVSSRRVIHTMRNGPVGATWIVASNKELKLSKTKPKLKEVVESGKYGVVRRIGDFALLKKGHDTAGNQQLINDWGL
jgi:uncharacterized membrane protein